MTAYRVILALHIVAIISWMAGILYLYRLLVYHAEDTEVVVKNRFKVMERKLYKIITFPAMIASVVFGFTMVIMNPALMHQGWFHGKLLLVAGLIAATFFAARVMKLMESDKSTISGRTLRLINEVPTLLMIGIVFLVILRPFG